MISQVGGLLTATQSAVVLAIKGTQSLIDKTQLALASGKKVNSALDNPQSFFLSKSLSDKAGDLMRLLDGVSMNIQRVNETDNGIRAILKLLDQAEALLNDADANLFSSGANNGPSSPSVSDIQAVLAANPGVSYSAASQSFYMWSPTGANWATADADAQAATLVQPASVTGVQGVGGHLAVITSQQENDFVKNLISAPVWISGTDSAVEGTWRWVGGPEDGQQFWQGLAGGISVGGLYSNWNAGEPNNSGNEDNIEMFNGSGVWNDLAGGNSLGSVIEWDLSSLSSPASAGLSARAAEYQTQYLGILKQIDEIARDSHYLGINLLIGNDLRTYFNPTGTSSLLTKGTDATSEGLGLFANDFSSQGLVESMRQEVRSARNNLRTYSGSVQEDFNIISTRLDFTKGSININQSGADDLVDADQNESGAELLATQVRQQMEVQTLAITQGPNLSNLLFGS